VQLFRGARSREFLHRKSPMLGGSFALLSAVGASEVLTDDVLYCTICQLSDSKYVARQLRILLTFTVWLSDDWEERAHSHN
jgi:hypothetical protein